MDERRTAAIFKAFCDENRIRIIKLLRSGEKCACKLLEEIKKENVTPSGKPALVNPINSGIEEHEQNGVTVPSNAAMIFAHIP